MASETKDTAERWYVCDLRASEMRRLGWAGPYIDKILITNKEGREIHKGDGRDCIVARIEFDNRPEELGNGNLSDARLIASAPDLLEAVRCILGIDNPPVGEPGHVDTNEVFKMARAAYEKAIGV